MSKCNKIIILWQNVLIITPYVAMASFNKLQHLTMYKNANFYPNLPLINDLNEHL